MKNFNNTITAYTEGLALNETPAETVARLIEKIGYDAARVEIAELVNSVGEWDGRISQRNRDWAASQADARRRAELDAACIYNPSEIHPAHIDQIADAMRETPVPEDEPEAADIIDGITAAIEAAPARSAWDKGVKVYALELLESLKEDADVDDLSNWAMLKRALLNGADSWAEYSWGGCSLIYDGDIAERLCTPSELKRKDGGRLQPNGREHWPDVQARALTQASWLIGCRTRDIMRWE